MKLRYYLSVALLGILLLFSGCEKILKEEVFSQLDPETSFKSVNGIEKLLFAAYNLPEYLGEGSYQLMLEECTTDQLWVTGGEFSLDATIMKNFSFDPSVPTRFSAMWAGDYGSIRDCNLVLENIDQSPVDATTKSRLIAEARFIRAYAYYILYERYGGVPLRLSTKGDLAMARATEQEMQSYFEKEFTEVANGLPNKGEISGYQYGRATKGAALGYLCRFYLNTKQWQKCADVAKQVMDMGIYQLWPDISTLFSLANEEKNQEFIWVAPAYAGTYPRGNELLGGIFPPAFSRSVDGRIVFTSNMLNKGLHLRTYDSFYNSFDQNDARKKMIISEYVNKNGATVSLLNQDNTRAFKYVPDPNAIGNSHGNDVPIIRYADILLSRAEALNELSGPTSEALDLIQLVRDRAGLTTSLVLASYTKESLRDHILNERGWEFYMERLRRQDLIRHGKFISSAQGRGITNAVEDRKLFPIPQTEINANPLCKQNPGY